MGLSYNWHHIGVQQGVQLWKSVAKSLVMADNPVIELHPICWIDFDLSSVKATYGQAELAPATLTSGERTTHRDLDALLGLNTDCWRHRQGTQQYVDDGQCPQQRMATSLIAIDHLSARSLSCWPQ